MNDSLHRRAAGAALLEFLRRPSSYPEPTRNVEVIETHFAWVFLTDAYAYKLKKPLRHDCMDYRSLAARKRGCGDELRLNRRLAPAVYLGLVPVVRARDGSLRIGRSQGATVVDWLVKMRRLPAERMLDRALLAERVSVLDVAAVAAVLSRFFESARRRPLTPRGYLARLRRAVRVNDAELSAASLRLEKLRARAVSRAQLAFIEENARQLSSRGALLVDGHGDLRPEHVFLGAGLRLACVIDCLEFSRDLRRLDPAEELAFLILECRRLGAKQAGRILLARFRQVSPIRVDPALLYFYMSQRAMTRAKLAAWHLNDPQFARQAAVWRAIAASYVADAAHYIRCASRAARWSRRIRPRDSAANHSARGPAGRRSTAAAQRSRKGSQPTASSTSRGFPAAEG
ncbi:MAG TPA: hypothetical protein VHB68_13060 [Steroidobacteraceae bacterium]|nr:hypothetical protein [Steroidobacteraceae bacterium]